MTDHQQIPKLENNRRQFVKKLTVGATLGAFAWNNLDSAIMAESSQEIKRKVKPSNNDNDSSGLKVLSERPLNAETPTHLLDDPITPNSLMFIRNNGLPPPSVDAKTWRLQIDGEVGQSLSLSLEDLKRYKSYSYQLVLECAGNGRAGFFPATPGLQWTYGGVACPVWEGVRLKDILADAKLKPSAVYVGYYSLDIHPSGQAGKVVISRGIPIAKALDEMTLIALKMNGEDIPLIHGYPARLISPGYPASASGKWLQRLWVRDRVHDGEKMSGYRVPTQPIEPGQEVPEKDMKIIELMPVKSIITFPESRVKVPLALAKKFTCRGFAWSGQGDIQRVDVSFDFGQTWVESKLQSAKNRFAWQRWEAVLQLPSQGYFEIWARATDESGKMQPMIVPGWNPHGYLNNAMQRIAVYVV